MPEEFHNLDRLRELEAELCRLWGTERLGALAGPAADLASALAVVECDFAEQLNTEHLNTEHLRRG